MTDIERGAPVNADYVIGEAYGGDYRFRLMVRLIEKGEINADQAEEILRYTKPSDPIEKVVGIVVGQTDASPLEISRALAGTEFAIPQSEVEAADRDFDTYMAQAGSTVSSIADLMGGYIKWPMDAAGSFTRSALGIEGTLLSEDDPLRSDKIAAIGDAAEAITGAANYWSGDRSADRDDQMRVRNMVRDEIKRLEAKGDLSSKQAGKMRNLTSVSGLAPPHAQSYRDLREQLTEVYMMSDEFAGETSSFLRDMPILNELKRREELFGGVDAERMSGGAARRATGIDEMGLPSEEEVRGIVVPGSDGVVTVNGPDDDVWDFNQVPGSSVGYYGGDDEITRRDRASYFGDGLIFDRSTGQTYTSDEWNLIKTDDKERAKYEATKRTAGAINEIFDKEAFSGVSTYGSVSQIASKGVFSGRGPQIPIEDLAIPSLSPTEPWETSTYDFRAGDGRAQWMSFTTRERRMRLKLMRDEGIITDAEYGEMGGINAQGISAGGSPFNLTAMNIWEGVVGLSADIQVDPIQAMRSIGEANRVAQANANSRGGGGGGGRGPTYSVPASLREIPDYKTLAEQTKGVFSQQLGRDMEDWELALLADELKDKYVQQNEQRIGIHKSAWNDAVAGGSVNVDFTAVEDPASALQFDIKEKYAAELDRYERVDDRANNRKLLLNSLAVGERMI